MPAAKPVANSGRSTITSGYFATPLQAYDKEGNKVWEQELYIYGQQRKRPSAFIPFKYQGLYEDAKTGLYYNRFRYYDPNAGSYISQDPIKLLGGLSLYSYVENTNIFIDEFGLRKGGGYSGVRVSNVGGEVNHIPAWNSIEIASKMNPELQNFPTHGTTPTIYMDRPNHKAMSSTGSSRNAKLWRKNKQN